MRKIWDTFSSLMSVLTVDRPCLPAIKISISVRKTVFRGPLLERPGNLPGPESDFDMKVSRKVGCVLTSDEVQFVSLADNWTVQFSNLLKLPLE